MMLTTAPIRCTAKSWPVHSFRPAVRPHAVRCTAHTDKPSTSGRITDAVSERSGTTWSSDELGLLLQANPELQSSINDPRLLEDCLTTIRNNCAMLRSHSLDPHKILLKAPRLLTTHLVEWWDFLSSYGFSEAQIKHIMAVAPQELAQATLLSAGRTITSLRDSGLDHYGVMQMCTYYPQTLRMPEEELKTLIRVLGSHQHTHGAI